MRAAVGPDPRAIQSHLVETNQSQAHRHSANLPKQILEFRLELGAELAECGVVDGPSLSQPHEVDRVGTSPLQSPAGSEPMTQAIENRPGHDLGVNGRLPRHQDVVPFPVRPVESIENFCEKPYRVILGDAVPQRLGEQEYLISGQGSLVPSTHISCLRTTARITNRGSSIPCGCEIDSKRRSN